MNKQQLYQMYPENHYTVEGIIEGYPDDDNYDAIPNLYVSGEVVIYRNGNDVLGSFAPFVRPTDDDTVPFEFESDEDDSDNESEESYIDEIFRLQSLLRESYEEQEKIQTILGTYSGYIQSLMATCMDLNTKYDNVKMNRDYWKQKYRDVSNQLFKCNEHSADAIVCILVGIGIGTLLSMLFMLH